MRITGIGSSLPELTVINDELTSFLDTSDEWIRSRTGIQERRILSGETIEALAFAAAEQALADADLTSKDIDYILCCNTYSAWMTPGLGCIVGSMLGISVPSLDINGACAGFIYALEVAQALVSSDAYKRILIVCAESPSHMVNWTDRATCVLFGDAAAAVVVDGAGKDLDFVLGNAPGVDFLYAHNPVGNSPYYQNATQPNGVQMNGQEVYRFAVSTATRDLSTLMEVQGLTAEAIDYFLIHQANLRIVEAVRARFKQPKDKFPTNIERYGNTLSASIPLLMQELKTRGELERGQTLAMSAFGAGLTAGTCVMEW